MTGATLVSDEKNRSNVFAYLVAVVVIGCLSALLIALTIRAVEAIV